jgi:NTE family protein
MNMHAEDIAMKSSQIRRRNGSARTLHLVLQGVGAHGAFGWGILDRLLEDGRIDISGITATSSGAINAVVYAYGQLTGGKEQARALLEDFWRAASSNIVGPLAPTPLGAMFGNAMPVCWLEGLTQVLSPYEFNPLNLNPLRSALHRLVDFDELHRSRQTQLTICATHVRSGRARIFSNRQITIDAVLASACQPQLSQAVEIEGESYWDGVYSGPALAPLLANSKSRDVLIGQISPVERRQLPRRAPDIQARVSEIAIHNSLLRETLALANLAQSIDENWIKPEYRSKLSRINVHAIRWDEIMSDFSATSTFDTSWRCLSRLRDMGRLAAELWLETHFEKIGVCSTIDLHDHHL